MGMLRDSRAVEKELGLMGRRGGSSGRGAWNRRDGWRRSW